MIFKDNTEPKFQQIYNIAKKFSSNFDTDLEDVMEELFRYSLFR